jgi:hypothetical protein
MKKERRGTDGALGERRPTSSVGASIKAKFLQASSAKLSLIKASKGLLSHKKDSYFFLDDSNEVVGGKIVGAQPRRYIGSTESRPTMSEDRHSRALNSQLSTLNFPIPASRCQATPTIASRCGGPSLRGMFFLAETFDGLSAGR